MSTVSDPSAATSSGVEEISDEELALLNASFEYARNGATDTLGALVGAGLPVNLTDGKGDTLLILAAYHGNAETVVMLLEAGADVNRQNDRGQTALSAAVFRKDKQITQLLLDAGGDPRTGLVSAMAVARQFGLTEFAELFGEG